MKRKKTAYIVLLLMLCLTVSGCRTRTGISRQTAPDNSNDRAGSFSAPVFGSLPGEETDSNPEKQEKNDDSGAQTKENPEASRKEYDETRPAEILPGTERTVHGEGEGNGLSADGNETGRTAAKLSEDAERTATQTVAAENAEQKGVSEEAAEADSATTYYEVLLQDRTGSLFECQRQNVYWETKEDHVTVFKDSPEHELILGAGAYDVSARLLEGNLHVDDGWIGRKDPGVIVKVTDRSVLGTGTVSDGPAKSLYGTLLARDGWAAMDAVRNGRVLLLSEELLEAPHLRLAAKLMIAKTANPELFADLSIDHALEMLAEEAAGSVPAGIFYYNGQGGL
jgi:hypothetical protein